VPLDSVALAAADASGPDAVEALHLVAHAPTATWAAPQCMLCLDGKKYWVKLRAQNGLAVELIVGRLAQKLGAGPDARIVRVGAGSGIPAGSFGLGVGVEDVPDAFNARDLGLFEPSGRLASGRLERQWLCSVLVFQTWIGVSDQQVLLRLGDGAVFSIDHGAAFSGFPNPTAPAVVVTPIPDVPESERKVPSLIDAAVSGVENLSDDDLLAAVARIPDEPGWQADPGRRLAIAQWLAHRRGLLRGVMDSWLRT